MSSVKMTQLRTFSYKTLLILQVFVIKIIQSDPVTPRVELSQQRISAVKDLANKLNNLISASVDPCSDFYDYVCLNFNESDKLVKTYPDLDYVKLLLNQYLLVDDDLDNTDLKAKHFFQSCENKELNLKDFLKDFNFPNSIGGWPGLVKDWSGKDFDFTSAVAELNSYGIQVLVDIRTTQREGKTFIALAPEKMQASEDMNKYQIYPRDSLLLSSLVENASEILNDYIFVEQQYLKLYPINETSNVVTTRTKFKDLKEWTPDFDWEKYLQIVTGMEFQDDYEIFLVNEEVLEQLLQTFANASERQLANFFFLKFLDLIVNNDAKSGWANCYEQTFTVFPQVFARTIVKNYFTDDDKKQLLDALFSLIDASDDFLYLYDGATKEEIKADVREFIFDYYLSKITNEEINDEFQALQITPDSYLKNILNIINRNVKEIFQSIFRDQGKRSKMRLFLGESLSQAIFYGHNKPVSVFLNEIDLLLLAALTIRAQSLPNHEFPQVSVECFENQLGVEKVNKVTLWQNELLQNLVKAYNSWAQDNKDLNEQENEILKEFGLSNKKVLLLISMQETCWNFYPPKDKVKTHQASWANLKEFAEEFNCPDGTAMNPSIKCNFM